MYETIIIITACFFAVFIMYAHSNASVNRRVPVWLVWATRLYCCGRNPQTHATNAETSTAIDAVEGEINVIF
jgi:hypothetical protein